MQLHIVGIDQSQHHKVLWVELQTTQGNLVVQPEHAPTVVALQPGSQVRFCLDSSKQKVFEVSSGFAHITRHEVTILLDSNL